MKILISNDDGLLANGIRALIEALAPCHDVYVVAPDRERSAAGHSLTLHTPLRVEEVNAKYGAKRCWMTTGTPGDCVKLAINAILEKDELPDLVISGINHGPNLGADILNKIDIKRIPPKTILNINVPGLEKEDIGGVAVTELGSRMFTDAYEKRIDPRGKVYYWMAGELVNEPEDAATDIAAVRNNKISITPVTYEMTRTNIMQDLEETLCKENLCNWF